MIEYYNGNFINDTEKMYDFKKLSKKEFLESYNYLTEAEYDNTAKELLKNLYQRLDQIEAELKLEYKDGETCWAANLEAEYERIEELICKIELEGKRSYHEKIKFRIIKVSEDMCRIEPCDIRKIYRDITDGACICSLNIMLEEMEHISNEVEKAGNKVIFVLD